MVFLEYKIIKLVLLFEYENNIFSTNFNICGSTINKETFLISFFLIYNQFFTVVTNPYRMENYSINIEGQAAGVTSVG